MLHQRHSGKAASRTTGISEKAFQAAIIQMATLAGWLCHHEYDSRRSTPGYPDLTLTRNGRLLICELKAERGRIRPEQRAWLAALAQCPGVEVALLRPRDWPVIEAALLHGKPLTTERINHE